MIFKLGLVILLAASVVVGICFMIVGDKTRGFDRED